MFDHDLMGRLTQINPPGSWVNTDITYSFSGVGGVVQTVTKGQAKETITYDSMFQRTLERRQALDTGWSSYVNTTYDGLGRVIFKSQPSSSFTETKGVETTYDGLGRIYDVTETVAPFAKTRHRYYSSHRHRIYDPSNAFTQYYSYGYDGPGNTDYSHIYKYDSNSIVLQRTKLYKNVHGQLTRLRQWGDYGGLSVDQSQRFYYDSNQRLCRHYVPEHGATRYQYDAAGQVVAYAKGQNNSGCGAIGSVSEKVSQTYDGLGRNTFTNFQNSATPDISRGYDDNGNVTFVSRGGVNWTYDYNQLNLLISEELDVDGRNYDIGYSYNSSGFLTQKTQPNNRTINYTVDGLGRMTTIKNGTATLASNTTFHPSGSVAGMNYANGQSFTQTLNDRLLPLRLRSASGGNVAIDQTLGYDARGLITSITDGAVSGNNRAYGYDPLGQLATASGPWGSGSFSYDSLGNLRSKQLGSRTVTLNYDAAKNRLSQSLDTGASGTRTVAYDGRGNVTTLGNLTFLYDMSDQPTVVSGTANGIGAANGNYTYDGNLKRVKSVVNGKTIYNVYDASGGLVHVDAVTDAKTTDYVTGPMGTLARITNGAVTYLHPDHLGSAQSGTNSSGAVAWREQYTPFGEERQSPAANDNLGGFTGHIRDKATGLNYMQARYYDPVIGRFLSVDPVGFMETGLPGQFNRYAYTWNDPINATDPDGEFLKLVKSVYNVGKRTYKNGGNLKGALKDEALSYVENGAILLDSNASLGDKAFAVFDLATGFGDEAKGAKRLLGGKCCFVAGTLVETEFGLRPIEEIELGDRVLARNPETGETALKAVTDLIRLNERMIWEVSLSGENNSSEFFETTDDHPWWIVDTDGNGSWKTTAELSNGMIVTTADNQTMVITKIAQTDRIDATYNLTVADFETYFVGENKVLVHNCPSQGPRFFRGKRREEALAQHRSADGSLDCAYCDKKLTETPGQSNSVTVDHIDAYSKGGATSVENAAPACKSCNSSKSDKELGTEWTPPKDKD